MLGNSGRLPCARRVSPKEWGCLGSSWWAFSLTLAAVGLLNNATSISSVTSHTSIVKAGVGLKCRLPIRNVSVKISDIVSFLFIHVILILKTF